MVNCPPLRNSKRCFKASTQNHKIEALKLVGEPKVAIPRFRPCAVSGFFYNREFLNSQVSFCHGRQKSEPPWTAVVPGRNEFENYHICIIGVFKLMV
ncbi:hypothetical protein DWQ65_00905 [Treponema phagedenis]|nr:hypothetical protein FUT79_12495 [Treponema phagedenis]QSH94686.1 hypothetical protein C5O78_06465 [Treponema phagedenis]QSH98649.1 hypothetical protein DWQ65_00905 [Treponema phagedenis]TYT78460.1 hypothetical protein FS559_04660 [Treponema phagedenis]